MNGWVRTAKGLLVGAGAMLLLAGCSWFGLGARGGISVVFTEGANGPSGSVTDARFSEADSTTVQGLYFGEFEIVAYNYRPGQSVQTDGFGRDTGNNDWSHYVVLQSGHPDARDVVLFSNDAVDVSALDPDGDPQISREYLNTVGTFDIDVLEFNLFRNGVIIDNVYYGAHAEGNGFEGDHPLFRYPEWSDIPQHHATTRVAGFETFEQTHNVMFVRDDWFSEPVLVSLEDPATQYEVAWSSKPLTPFQRDILVSLATDGTTRRFYANLIIVPYGPARTVDLAGGEEIAVTVRFDFSDAIDFSEGRTDLQAIRDIPWPQHHGIYLWFKTDEEGIPMGLSVEFD